MHLSFGRYFLGQFLHGEQIILLFQFNNFKDL